MPITCLGDCGHSSGSGVSGGVGTINTFSITLTQAIPAKSRAYVLICGINTNSLINNSDFTITDTGLNAYAGEAIGGAGAGSDGISLYILSATVTTALSVGDTVTVNIANDVFGNPQTFQSYLCVVLASSPTKRVFDDTTGNTSNHGSSYTATGSTTLGSNVSANHLKTTPKITLSLMATNADQTFTETYTPNYTHALKFAIGSGANQGTLSVSYALSNSPDGVTASTYAPTYSLDSSSAPGVAGHNSLGAALNDYFIIDSQAAGKLSHDFNPSTGRRFIGAINSSGQAVIYLDDTLFAASETGTVVTVDSAATCLSPSVIALPDGRVHYVYARGGNSYSTFSDDAGKTWSAAVQIAASKTIPDHDWNDLFPAAAMFNESDSTFYISTGTTDGSGAVTWNAPVSTGITGLEISPSLRWYPAGYWELVYQDSSGIQIKRCRNLRADGTGTWS